jgi:hypothetical protein
LACYAAIDQAGTDRILSLTVVDQTPKPLATDAAGEWAEADLNGFLDEFVAPILTDPETFAADFAACCSIAPPSPTRSSGSRRRTSTRRGTPPSRSCSAGAEKLSDSRRAGRYSHSIVPGGLDVMSSVTRLTCVISLIMREATFSSRSYGRRAQSAVIASSLVTALITTTYP